MKFDTVDLQSLITRVLQQHGDLCRDTEHKLFWEVPEKNIALLFTYYKEMVLPSNEERIVVGAPEIYTKGEFHE